MRHFIILFILIFSLGACGSPAAEPTAMPVATPTPIQPATPTAETITLTDDTGATITLTNRPQRIACLIDLCVDIVAELGMEPVAFIDELALQPQFFGERAKTFIRIGGSYFEPSLEDIARAKPDLVIGYPTHAPLRDGLRPIAPLFVMQPTNGYRDVLRYVRQIGELVGRESEANAAIDRFNARLNAYKERVPRDVTVLFMTGTDFDASFGIDTKRSIVGSVLAEVANYPWDDPNATPTGLVESYSLEQVLATNPDVLFIGTFLFGGGQGLLSEQLANNPLWGQIKAVQQGRVHEVSVPIWVTGQGTRSLQLVLDEAMTKIYPDRFPKPLP